MHPTRIFETPEEQWENIEGFSGYKVSNTGKVISYRRVNPVLLKPSITKTHCGKRYQRIALFDGKKHHTFYLHRIVAGAFIPNPLNKPQVHHIDNNLLNNNRSNLEWVTNSENQVYRSSNSGNRKNDLPAYVHKSRNNFRVEIKRLSINKSFKTLKEASKYASKFYG